MGLDRESSSREKKSRRGHGLRDNKKARLQCEHRSLACTLFILITMPRDLRPRVEIEEYRTSIVETLSHPLLLYSMYTK